MAFTPFYFSVCHTFHTIRILVNISLWNGNINLWYLVLSKHPSVTTEPYHKIASISDIHTVAAGYNHISVTT